MEIRSDLPVLVAFKVRYHVLVSLLSFEEVFPEANFGLCCCALTGTCKKKLKSFLGIFFLGKALDGSSAHVWTKPCLFPCAWAISPCIFKLRTVRFEWLFQTLNTVSLRLRAEMVKLFRVLCLVHLLHSWPASSQLSDNRNRGTSLPVSCYLWLFSSHVKSLTAGEGMGWSPCGQLPQLTWVSKTGCCVAAGTFSIQKDDLCIVPTPIFCIPVWWLSLLWQIDLDSCLVCDFLCLVEQLAAVSGLMWCFVRARAEPCPVCPHLFSNLVGKSWILSCSMLFFLPGGHHLKT